MKTWPALIGRLLAIGGMVLSGCGGGGGSSGAASPQLSGTIAAAPFSAIDSDTQDSNSPRQPNDSAAQAQVIGNPVTLGGHADLQTDPADRYRVQLAAGQVITLYIAGDGQSNDLDLGLLNQNNELVVSSLSVTNRETIVAPTGGLFDVLVAPFSGASNYVLTISPPGAPAAFTHGMRTDADFIPGQMLLRYVEANAPQAKTAIAGLAAHVLGEIPGFASLLSTGEAFQADIAAAQLAVAKSTHGFVNADVRARHQTLLALKQMATVPGVLSVDPNFRYRTWLLPDDEFFPLQWNYELLNAQSAWDITQGSSNVVVAVIDTGVVLSHPDLVGKFDPAGPSGVDFVSDVNSANDGDGIDNNADDPGDSRVGGSSFHGTHVAGVIGANTDNQAGVAALGWNTSLMPLRALGNGGSGSSFDIINAVRYAAGLENSSGSVPARPADVINMSLGCTGCFSSAEQAVYDEVRSRGVMVVAAAGNEGNSALSYPASYDGVISVAAVGPPLSGIAQRAPYSQFNAAVDVAAPGGDQGRFGVREGGILSTLANDTSGQRVPVFGFLQGTSMATPHVSAVIALMRAVHPNLSPVQFDTLLRSGAITNGRPNADRNDEIGFGIIDAAAAVREAQSLAGGSPLPAVPRLSVQPLSLDFGASLTSLSLLVRNSGDGELTVAEPVADQAFVGLRLIDDRNGELRYAVTVDRSNLADGSYSASIDFSSSANSMRIPVFLSVGGPAPIANAGLHYVLLVDAQSGETAVQQIVMPENGVYAFQFDEVRAGRYQIISGTDSDEDGFICDEGEACGAYTTLDQLTEVNFSGASVTGLDFTTGFQVNTVAAASPVRQKAAGARKSYRLRPLPESKPAYRLR